MLNNEFRIIGTALSDFEDISNKQYKSYLLRVEVEKNGSKIRENSTIEVQN